MGLSPLLKASRVFHRLETRYIVTRLPKVSLPISPYCSHSGLIQARLLKGCQVIYICLGYVFRLIPTRLKFWLG